MPSRDPTPAEPARLTPGRRWLAVALIAAAVIAAYANSLRSPLFFDDTRCLGENPSIRQLWPPGPVLAPAPHTMLGSRPLANLSFALNYAAGGLDVTGYHLVNSALHLAAALLLFGVVRRTLAQAARDRAGGERAFFVALIAAVAWAAHPLLVAAVGYISQRTEVLMGLFYLLTLYAFIRGAEAGGHRGWLAASAAACALGTAAKEVTATAPLAVLLLDRAFFAGTLRAALARRPGYYAALAASWLLLAWLMRRGLDPTVGAGRGAGPWDYALVQCRAIATYAARAVWPHPLAFDYGEFTPLRFLGALPYAWAPLLLLGGAALGYRRRSAAGFWCAWIALALAPTSSFVPITLQPIAENRTYLPLAGALALLAAGLWRAAGRRAVPIAVVATCALIALTAQRNARFRDPIAPWTDAVALNPANARAHSNAAIGLQFSGRVAEAEAHYRRALALKPADANIHSSYASLLQRLGRTAEAIEHGAEAVRLEPRFAEARSNLAASLLSAGRTAEGIEQLQAALRLDPSRINARHNLALALTYSGRPAEALEHFAAVFRARPGDATFRFQFGNALFSTGDFAAAVQAYQSALALNPAWPDARHNLAVALERLGRTADAQRELEAVLQAQPDHAAARAALERMRGAGR